MATAILSGLLILSYVYNPIIIFPISVGYYIIGMILFTFFYDIITLIKIK